MKAFGLAESAAAARQIVLLIEGAMTLMLVHGDIAYAKAAGDAAQILVGADTSGGSRPRKAGAAKG
jgi:hypothetical protein